MRHWEGQADVNCLNQSEHTQSWCEMRYTGTKISSTPRLISGARVIVVENEFKPQPCLTIQYTNDETLGGPTLM